MKQNDFFKKSKKLFYFSILMMSFLLSSKGYSQCPTGTLPATTAAVTYPTIGSTTATLSQTATVPSEYTGYVIFIHSANAFVDPTNTTGATDPISVTTSGQTRAYESANHGSQQALAYTNNAATQNINISGLKPNTTYYVKVFGYTRCDIDAGGGTFTYDYHYSSAGSSVTTFTTTALSDISSVVLNHTNTDNGGIGSAQSNSQKRGDALYIDNVAVTTPFPAEYTGNIIYINSANSFTKPADILGSTSSTLSVNNTTYTTPGQQQLIVAHDALGNSYRVSMASGLIDNTTYYYRTFAYRKATVVNADGSTTYNYFFSDASVDQGSDTTFAVNPNVAHSPVIANVTGTSMQLASFSPPQTSSVAATGYVIKMNTSNSFSSISNGPLNFGVPFQLGSSANADFQNSGEQIIYVGTSPSPSLNITSLSADTEYYFSIMVYTNHATNVDIFQSPDQGYTFSQSTTTTKPTPTITFDAISKNFGDADFTLPTATSNSAGAIRYYMTTPTSGTSLNGSTITLGNAGDVTIVAVQEPTATYQGTSVSTILTINKIAPQLSFSNLAVNTNSGSHTLVASSSNSSGTISYSIEANANGSSIAGNIFTAGPNATQVLIRATLASDTNYLAATKDAIAAVSGTSNSFLIGGESANKIYRYTIGQNALTTVFTTPTHAEMNVQPAFIQTLPYKLLDNPVVFNGKIWVSSDAYFNPTASPSSIKQALCFSYDEGTNTIVQQQPQTASGGFQPGQGFKVIDGSLWLETRSSNRLIKYPLDGSGNMVPIIGTSGTSPLPGTFSFGLGLGNTYEKKLVFNGKVYFVYNTAFSASITDRIEYGVLATVDDSPAVAVTNFYTPASSTIGFTSASEIGGNIWIGYYDLSTGYTGGYLVFNASTDALIADYKLNQVFYPGDLTLIGTKIWGIDQGDGNTNRGRIFSMNTDATGFSIVKQFNAPTVSEAADPSLSFSKIGTTIYGLTKAGGANAFGEVYSLETTTDTYSTLAPLLNTATSSTLMPVLEPVGDVTPLAVFNNQSVYQANTVTLDALTASPGAITYSIVGDAHGSSINGDQFTAGTAGNTVTVRASIAAGSGFTATTIDMTVTLIGDSQTITFNPIPNKSSCDAAFSLTPTSTNTTIPILYGSSDPNIATVTSEGLVTIVATGTVNITASQASGTVNGIYYLAAPNVVQSLTIDNGDTSLTQQTVTISGNEALCTTNNTIISLASSEIGVNYSLRNNADNSVIGSPIAGTGGAISFPNQTVTVNSKTFNVLAVKNLCSRQMANTVTTTIIGVQDQTVTLTQPTQQSAIISLASTQIGITYSLQISGISGNIGASIVGTGNAISFPEYNLDSNRIFRVYAEVTGESTCFLTLSNQPTSIYVPPTQAAISGMWSTPSTWIGGVLPTAATSIQINSGTTITVDIPTAEANVVDIEGTLQIDNTKALTVENNFTNVGTVTISSTTANSGVLFVKGTSSGMVTYERGGLVGNAWSLISAPVAGQNIKDFVENAANDIRINTSVTPNRYAVGYYDDSQAAGAKWVYYDVDFLTANPNTTFEIGRSYAFSRATSGVLTFTGTLTVDNTAKTVTASEWNAIGNPFTAFVPTNQNSNNNFISDNTANFDPTNIAVYLWDNTQNKYIARSLVDAAQTSLPPGQGFFIRTNTGVASVDFNKDQRMTQPATGNTNFGRSSTPSIQLFIERDGTKVDTQIKYYSTATKGLDPGYDIGNFGGTSFDIYTHLLEDSTGQEFTIQSLPDSDYQNMPIPIGVKATSGNLITFSATVSNIPEGIEVILEDTITGNFTRLDVTDASYTITLNEDINDTSRFVLHTNASTLSNGDTLIKNDVQLFVTDQRVLHVNGLDTKATVKLYDILGKEILSRNMDVQNSTEIQLSSSLQQAIYIIKLQTENGTITQKIILQ